MATFAEQLAVLGWTLDTDVVVVQTAPSQFALRWRPEIVSPPSQAQVQAVTQAQVDAYYATQARTDAKAQAQRDGDPSVKLLLALLATQTQALNTLRQELARLRADVRGVVPTVPTRPAIPTETLAEARQAVRDAIDTV